MIGAAPHLYRCLPVLSHWPVTVTAMAAPRSKSTASTLGLSRWWLIFTKAVTGDWMSAIPMPCSWLTSANSEFFAPLGNTLITNRETEDFVRTCCLPSVRQQLTTFDGYNAAALQPTNVLPELPRWLCCTGYGYEGITVR